MDGGRGGGAICVSETGKAHQSVNIWRPAASPPSVTIRSLYAKGLQDGDDGDTTTFPGQE